MEWHCFRVCFEYLRAYLPETVTSKNAFWPLTQNLLGQMSNRTSSFILALFLIICSFPFNFKRDGSNSTSLHISGKSVAVISLTSFCCNVANPPLVHDFACWTLKPSPHEQLTGKPGIDQSYCNLMEFQNYYLILNSFTLSQFDNPVSFEMTLKRFISRSWTSQLF